MLCEAWFVIFYSFDKQKLLRNASCTKGEGLKLLGSQGTSSRGCSKGRCPKCQDVFVFKFDFTRMNGKNQRAKKSELFLRPKLNDSETCKNLLWFGQTVPLPSHLGQSKA